VTRASDESGFTLVEVLIASVLSLIILGVTLTAFTGLVRTSKYMERQTEGETMARQGADRLARQLRNLASPADVITNVAVSTQPKSVDRNLPYDLIFKDIDEVRPAGSSNSANVRRVRYCLQTSGVVPGAGFSASPSRGVLWAQTQTWTGALPPAMPAAAECPGPGWTTQRIVADHLTNAAVAPARSVFRYSGDSGLVTDTSDAARETISRVETTLIVDADPTKRPAATQLTTSVILRNQNRAPIAAFTYTLLNPLLSPTTCSVQLNGSASEDPESKPLEYEWVIDDTAQTENGVVVQLTLPKGTHTFQLRVYDRAHLQGTSITETHTC
jgi:prepilin-type N-terminal cleavage/methylation domain-containing protein